MKMNLIYIGPLVLCAMACINEKPRESRKDAAQDAGTQIPSQPSPQPLPAYSSTPTVSPIQQPTQAECYKANPNNCAAERAITALTNQMRVSIGRPPLTHDAKLSFTARQWSTEQAANRSIGHSGFPNARLRAYSQEFGSQFTPNMNGENVAMTYVGRNADPQSIASAFMKMWQSSSGHYANMTGNHRIIGVGVSQSPDGGFYATQIFGN